MRSEETFGSMVLRRRKELTLTQSDLAQRVGVQPNYIVYLEKGERKPSDRTVLKMADALGIDRAELYLAANPELRDFLPITERNEVLMNELPAGLRELAADTDLRQRLNVSDEEIETVAQFRLRGRVTRADQYLTLILNMRFIFA